MLAPPRDIALAEVFAVATSVVEPASGIADLLGALLASRPAWHADALCQEHPEVSFFPGQGDDIRPAKAVCASCLVRPECRAWALDQGEELWGVWAGTTHKQRHQIRNADAPPRRQVVLAADGQPRPVGLMERLSGFLATHPDDTFTASAVRNATSGHIPSMTRALEMLAEEGYAAVTIGGTTNGRPYTDARFFSHLRTYVDAGSVTVVATDQAGRSTAA